MTSPQSPEATPLPELALALAIAHQAEQEAVAAQVAAGLGILFSGLAFKNLAETTAAWLHGVTLEIEKGWRASVALSKQFVQETLWAVEPGAGEIPDLPLEFPAPRVQHKMQNAGPNRVKHATKAAFLDDDSIPLDALEDTVMAGAKTESTGTGVMLALDGGREATKQSTQLAQVVPASELVRRRQERTIGWARFTDSNPCYFCAILASRGAVFQEDSFLVSSRKFDEGRNPAAVHPNCKCSLRPVFREEDRYDDRAKYFLSQWKTYTEGYSNYKPETGLSEAMKAFRRRYVPPPPYKTTPTVDLDALRRNRSALIANGFAEGSPQVRFYDEQIARFAA